MSESLLSSSERFFRTLGAQFDSSYGLRPTTTTTTLATWYRWVRVQTSLAPGLSASNFWIEDARFGLPMHATLAEAAGNVPPTALVFVLLVDPSVRFVAEVVLRSGGLFQGRRAYEALWESQEAPFEPRPLREFSWASSSKEGKTPRRRSGASPDVEAVVAVLAASQLFLRWISFRFRTIDPAKFENGLEDWFDWLAVQATAATERHHEQFGRNGIASIGFQKEGSRVHFVVTIPGAGAAGVRLVVDVTLVPAWPLPAVMSAGCWIYVGAETRKRLSPKRVPSSLATFQWPTPDDPSPPGDLAAAAVVWRALRASEQQKRNALVQVMQHR
jgi:hypothetical protein